MQLSIVVYFTIDGFCYLSVLSVLNFLATADTWINIILILINKALIVVVVVIITSLFCTQCLEMNQVNILSALLFILIPRYIFSAKILYLFPVGCKSSFLYHQKMVEILLQKGHDVTVISKFPQKEKILNYTDIDVSSALYGMADAISITNNPTGSIENLYIPYSGQLLNCENVYKNEKTKELLKQNFDLVLIEIAATKCFIPLAFAFNAPVIGVVAGAVVFSDFDGFIGNPGNPSYVPAIMSGVSNKMKFIDRLQNTGQFVLHFLFRKYYTYKGDVISNQYIGGPSTEELFNKLSLVFYNSHSSFMPQPLAPNTIEIAGIHLDKPSPLPTEIRNFVNEAKDGVIFVSLGSVVRFSSFPKEMHDTFIRAFSKLPYSIIWRHNDPKQLENIPKNVLVHTWLPQADILAEKKVVLFISHCGIFSIYEAMNYGVPILGIPVLYDQFTNAAIVENLGMGLKIDYRSINEEILLSSINTILKTKSFRENSQQLSEKFKKRPISPSETFIYWINYILHFKGAPHLKPPSLDLPFYKYLLLDVGLFVILLSVFSYRFINFIAASIFKLTNNKEKQS